MPSFSFGYTASFARNTLINHLRSAKIRRTDNLEDTPEPGKMDEYSFRQNAISEEVARILTKLKPEERELLAMRYMMEMDNSAIGNVVGLDSKTVSQRIMRLLQKCRKLTEGRELLEDD
jgi:RNA polymerase sigma-70 factor (ECF subfamily)